MSKSFENNNGIFIASNAIAMDENGTSLEDWSALKTFSNIEQLGLTGTQKLYDIVQVLPNKSVAYISSSQVKDNLENGAAGTYIISKASNGNISAEFKCQSSGTNYVGYISGSSFTWKAIRTQQNLVNGFTIKAVNANKLTISTASNLSTAISVPIVDRKKPIGVVGYDISNSTSSGARWDWVTASRIRLTTIGGTQIETKLANRSTTGSATIALTVYVLYVDAP